MKAVSDLNASEAIAELRAYRPLTKAEVRTEPEFLARRAAIFARIDDYVRRGGKFPGKRKTGVP